MSSPDQPPKVQKDLPNPPKIRPIALRPDSFVSAPIQPDNNYTQPPISALHHPTIRTRSVPPQPITSELGTLRLQWFGFSHAIELPAFYLAFSLQPFTSKQWLELLRIGPQLLGAWTFGPLCPTAANSFWLYAPRFCSSLPPLSCCGFQVAWEPGPSHRDTSDQTHKRDRPSLDRVRVPRFSDLGTRHCAMGVSINPDSSLLTSWVASS
jgi:hypothetical protein